MSHIEIHDEDADTPRDEDEGINIEVTGGQVQEREVVCAVIQEALVNAGFKDVSTIDEAGDVIDTLDGPSLLDEARRLVPELFNAPVTLSSSFSAEVEDETDRPDLTTRDEVIQGFEQAVAEDVEDSQNEFD